MGDDRTKHCTPTVVPTSHVTIAQCVEEFSRMSAMACYARFPPCPGSVVARLTFEFSGTTFGCVWRHGGSSEMERINYNDLNPKQQEIYNFQKCAALLADYGFNCIKLADDWQGADFLAYHKDGTETLKVQLKGRLTIDKRYLGRDLWMIFRVRENWFLIKHDELVQIVGRTTGWLESDSWKVRGGYSSGHPRRELVGELVEFWIGKDTFNP